MAQMVSLSPRERECLFLASQGVTDKGIAAMLGIRLPTVESYWQRIFGKLGAVSRTHAYALALKRGESLEQGTTPAARA